MIRVLVVVDNQSRWQPVFDALARRGHEVIWARSADIEDTVRQADDCPLVLIDAGWKLGIPESLNRYRKVSDSGCRVVVAMSEPVDPSQLSTLLAAGADDYLVLPADDSLIDLRLAVAERLAARRVLDDQISLPLMSRLAESESRYRLIADNVSDLIWTVRMEGPLYVPSPSEGSDRVPAAENVAKHWRFEYASPSVERMLGYTVEEMEELTLREILSPQSYERAIAAMAEDLGKEPKHGEQQRTLELEHLTKHGAVRICEVTVAFLRNESNRLVRLVGITRDITLRRQAEEALRESESTLRGLFENMPDVVLLVDTKGNVQYINHAADGAPQSEFTGHSGFEFIAPAFHDVCRAGLQQAIETEQVQTIDAALVRGRYWYCRLVPMVKDEHVQNVMIICTDVTAIKEAEQRVQQEQQLLKELLELHERDRSLLAFELHDGFSQLLTGALLNLDAAKRIYKEDADVARQNFDRGLRLLRESIVESRRLVSGLRPPVLDEFGIVPAIEHLVEQCREDGGPDVTFESTMQHQRLAYPLESAVFRIVQETLTNAKRHSQSDKIRVELHQRDGQVRVEIQDWGVGFDPQTVEEARFGLKGIRERARLLGGQATIEAAPGEGVHVTVELPLLEDTRENNHRSGGSR